MIEKAHLELSNACGKHGMELETCGEGLFKGTPCLSQKDIDILGLTDIITLEGNKGQRKTCSCPANKKQLFHGEKPHPCKNNCLYCYWKDEQKKTKMYSANIIMFISNDHLKENKKT